MSCRFKGNLPNGKDCILFDSIRFWDRLLVTALGATVAVIVPFLDSGILAHYDELVLGGKIIEFWLNVILVLVGWYLAIHIVARHKMANRYEYALGAISFIAVIYSGSLGVNRLFG